MKGGTEEEESDFHSDYYHCIDHALFSQPRQVAPASHLLIPVASRPSLPRLESDLRPFVSYFVQLRPSER